MPDAPPLTTIADLARLGLSPDERSELVAELARLRAWTLERLGDGDGDETLPELPPQDPRSAATIAGPPASLADDVAVLQDDAQRRFTALSPAARDGFFVLPRTHHGRGQATH